MAYTELTELIIILRTTQLNPIVIKDLSEWTFTEPSDTTIITYPLIADKVTSTAESSVGTQVHLWGRH